MKPLKRRSIIEQSAEHVRTSIKNKTWTGRLPGVVKLAEEVGVSKLTMRAALRILEDEGIVVLAENGYSRHVASHSDVSKKNLRIGFLLAEPLGEQVAQFQQVVLDIQHQLEDSGLEVFLYSDTLRSLRHDPGRVEEAVSMTPVDACIVVGGSYEVLEWFSNQSLPCLALFGRGGSLPIARVGPQKTDAIIEAVQFLIKLGHKRIVRLVRGDRREPSLGYTERLFLKELEAHGIETSHYNLPDWEETPQGLSKLLEQLFKVTPPTALITDEVPVWVATQQFLASKQILIPEHVSLISSDYDPTLFWCDPAISHFSWESDPIVRHVVRWVHGVKQGKVDTKQKLYPASFVKGGTIGPVPR